MSLRADEESTLRLVPADTEIEKEKIKLDRVIGRSSGELTSIAAAEIDYLDVSPKQMVGVSAGLIPFLEHDDANRALMGSRTCSGRRCPCW